MTRRSFNALLVASAALLVCFACDDESRAQPVVVESAVMGMSGKLGGASITTAQYIGWRFQINQTLIVDHIGGHLLSVPDVPGGIFAAFVRLQSITSVPTGAPFDPGEIVATTTFRAPFPSAEVFTPFSATLTPGSYSLVLGTGLFGATGQGAAPNGTDQPDIPPTNLSSFIFWSIPFIGQPPEWRQNLASHMRFVIQAQVAIPGDLDHNGTVDAADYVFWRKTTGPPADYTDWRANFGRTSAGGSSINAPLGSSVPEPAAVASLLVAAGMFVLSRPRAVKIHW